MNKKIKTISLPLPFHLGSVNCYLIDTDADQLSSPQQRPTHPAQ